MQSGKNLFFISNFIKEKLGLSNLKEEIDQKLGEITMGLNSEIQGNLLVEGLMKWFGSFILEWI